MEKRVFFLISLFLICGFQSLFAAPTADQYLDAGDKLFQEKDFNKSLLYYKAAVQTDPQNWKAYQAQGNCELNMGQRENAINDFQKSLNINPNNPALQDLMNKLSQTGPAPVFIPSSLPQAGKIVGIVGGAVNIFGWQDLADDYYPIAPTITPGATFLGGEFDLGCNYTMSYTFQLGVQAQAILKQTESTAPSLGVTDIYSESCVGGALVAEYLISLGPNFNVILHGEGGGYTLIDSTGNVTNNTLSQINELSSSALGASGALEIEWVQNDGWALDFGVGYRELTFSTVTFIPKDSAQATPTTLINLTSGKNAYLDFSGPRLNLAVRFF